MFIEVFIYQFSLYLQYTKNQKQSEYLYREGEVIMSTQNIPEITTELKKTLLKSLRSSDKPVALKFLVKNTIYYIYHRHRYHS